VTGRVVVITGASGGIGRATALEFARHGDRLALLARGETGLVPAAEEVRACGSEALAFTSVFARFADVTPAEYKRVTEVSYLGYVYATMAHAVVVTDVVAVVPQRAGVDRVQPQAADTQPGQIVQPADQALQVADPVAVGVLVGRARGNRSLPAGTSARSWVDLPAYGH
jgi:NAD(P)-dependent dehydrogenase (short-subunit alcohol dehydrogenase family)